MALVAMCNLLNVTHPKETAEAWLKRNNCMPILDELGGMRAVHWVADVYVCQRRNATKPAPMRARARKKDDDDDDNKEEQDEGPETRGPKRVWFAILGMTPTAHSERYLKMLEDQGCAFGSERQEQKLPALAASAKEQKRPVTDRYAVAVAVPGTSETTIADLYPPRNFNTEPHCALQALLKEHLPIDISNLLIRRLQYASEKQTEAPTTDVAYKDIKFIRRRWGFLKGHFKSLSPRWDGPGLEPATVLQAFNWEPPTKSPGRGRLLQDPERRHLAGHGLRLQGWHLPAGARR